MSTMHQVMICNEQSQRLAVLDVAEHHGQSWVDCCRAAAFRWLRLNDQPFLRSSVATGDLIVWVGGGSRCYPFN